MMSFATLLPSDFRNASWSMLLLYSVVVAGAFSSRLQAQDREVVVYVSHDEEHSKQILDAFQEKTGITVLASFDTEDNKTVGLVTKILKERSRTVCDVFWNNECGQSERLKAAGALSAYRSPMAEGIPAEFKDAEGYWTGFAARSRVLVWNPELITEKELPDSLEELTASKWSGKLAMAKPLTGTTLTHVAALYSEWEKEGKGKTDGWLRDLIQNDVLWERGNGQSCQSVADGVRPIGLTDTDDVNVRRLAGLPVKAKYLGQGENGDGCFVIPNSVMILKDAPHRAEAEALIDFLLSPEVEAMLARGRAAQMPLRAGVAVPEHVTPVSELKTFKVDFAAVGTELANRAEGLGVQFERVAGGQVTEGKSGPMSLLLACAALLVAGMFIFLAMRKGRA